MSLFELRNVTLKLGLALRLELALGLRLGLGWVMKVRLGRVILLLILVLVLELGRRDERSIPKRGGGLLEHRVWICRRRHERLDWRARVGARDARAGTTILWIHRRGHLGSQLGLKQKLRVLLPSERSVPLWLDGHGPGPAGREMVDRLEAVHLAQRRLVAVRESLVRLQRRRVGSGRLSMLVRSLLGLRPWRDPSHESVILSSERL